MSPFRINPSPVPNPNLLRLTNLRLRPRLHKSDLDCKLFRLPEIIGIEKSQISAACATNTEVARGGHTTPALGKEPQVGAVSPQMVCRTILRPIVHHDELESFITLAQDRLDRIAEHRPAIVCGDDNAH